MNVYKLWFELITVSFNKSCSNFILFIDHSGKELLFHCASCRSFWADCGCCGRNLGVMCIMYDISVQCRTLFCAVLIISYVWPNGLRRRFYDDSDRRIMSSTRTLVTLLRPWIRRFTIIISAWWLRTSSKFRWEEVKTSTGKLGKWSTPKRVRIRPKYSAPSLSRDRRIKMH